MGRSRQITLCQNRAETVKSWRMGLVRVNGVLKVSDRRTKSLHDPSIVDKRKQQGSIDSKRNGMFESKADILGIVS